MFHRKCSSEKIFGWSPIRNHTAWCCNFSPTIDSLAESKWNYFYVSMHYVVAVQIFQCLHSLVKEFVSLWMRWRSLLFQHTTVVFEKTSIFGVLHHHENFVVLYYCVPKLDNMGMIHSTMDFYLTTYYLQLFLSKIIVKI